jgi:GH24 family phage-related lysozyme (muramidase)
MARKIRRSSSDKKAAAEKILRELQDAKKSDDAPEGLDDLIKSIQNEAKREEKRKKEVTAIVKTIGKSNKQQSKPAKQEDIDPRILELLGIEDYEAELDYEDYAVLLKEAMVKRTISGSEDKEGDTEILKKELKRARSSSGKFKPKKKTVKASNFVGSTETTGQTAQQASGKITTLGSTGPARTEIKQENREEFVPLAATLTRIDDNLKQVLELDREKNKKEKRAANKLRREKATASRRAREAKMEGGGSKADPKAIEKAAKPFTGAFDAIMNFFKNIALGGLVNFLLEVVKDPGIIVRPFYDFGNFVIDFINKYVIGFVNEFLLAPVNLLIGGLNNVLSGINDMINSLKKLNPFDDSPPNEFERIGDVKLPEIPNLEYPQWAQKQEGGGEVVDANSISMVKGGAIDQSTGLKVSGMGKDTQLIAAEPGEVMMSRKAVDAYGASNLLKANAAAGGSNIPTFGKILGMSGGGMVGGENDNFAKEMIKVHEGLRLDKYLDSRGFPTIGYGHLIEKGESMPDRITKQKADELFDMDYEHHKAAAKKIPGYDKASGLQKAALIDLTFNMGPAWASGFPSFKKAFAAGDYDRAGKELVDSAWYGQVGRRAPTIVNLIKGKSANAAYLKDAPKPTPGTGGSNQAQMSSSSPSSSSDIQPYSSSGGGGAQVAIPLPQKQSGTNSASSAGQKSVPGFSAEDMNNFDLIVVKSIYNIVG